MVPPPEKDRSLWSALLMKIDLRESYRISLCSRHSPIRPRGLVVSRSAQIDQIERQFITADSVCWIIPQWVPTLGTRWRTWKSSG